MRSFIRFPRLHNRRRKAVAKSSDAAETDSRSRSCLSLLQAVERQVELQHIDMRLADDAEETAGGIASTSWRTCASGRPRALATRGTWNSAPAGVMSGSSPLAEVVTRSTGTGVSGFRRPVARRRPSPGRPAPSTSGRGSSRPNWRHCRAPARSWSHRSGRCRSWPRARPWKYSSAVKFCPISAEPMILPSRLDQAAIGLMREDEPGDAGHRERIGEPGDDRHGDDHHDGRADLLQHGAGLLRPGRWR